MYSENYLVHFGHIPLQVQTLSAHDVPVIAAHFLQLNESDRYLRFGSYVQDPQIHRYIEHIDFEHDSTFGVFNVNLELVGVGHLAPMAADNGDRPFAQDKRGRMAEFGISVHEQVRGLGVGSALFGHALTHCRNRAIYYLYMHCLSKNQGIMTIAKRAGMDIQYDYGEADAYLALNARNLASLMTEAMNTQTSNWNYSFKSYIQKSEMWQEKLKSKS